MLETLVWFGFICCGVAVIAGIIAQIIESWND